MTSHCYMKTSPGVSLDIASIMHTHVVKAPHADQMNMQIKPSLIEKRLDHLDEAGDNDYFKVPYGAYSREEWGSGI